MSPACCLNVSSESLPPLMKPPRSLSLALPTMAGRSSPNPCTAPLTALPSTSTTRTITSTIASTSTAAASPRLQPDRSIAFTTGNRTATLKTETKMARRTSATEASAHATATATATSKIVLIEIESSTSRRPVSASAA